MRFAILLLGLSWLCTACDDTQNKAKTSAVTAAAVTTIRDAESSEPHAIDHPSTDTYSINTNASDNKTNASRKPVTNNTMKAHFEGFNTVTFGENAEAVKRAWAKPLSATTPSIGASCYYLHQEPSPLYAKTHQPGIAFMFEDGRFVRFDVDDPAIIAPGGIVVGDSLEQLLSAHTKYVDVQAHKVIEGAKTVIVTESALTPTSKTAKLIFELDAQDLIVEWRIGISPQVYYVAGCS